MRTEASANIGSVPSPVPRGFKSPGFAFLEQLQAVTPRPRSVLDRNAGAAVRVAGRLKRIKHLTHRYSPQYVEMSTTFDLYVMAISQINGMLIALSKVGYGIRHKALQCIAQVFVIILVHCTRQARLIHVSITRIPHRKR